MEFCGCRLWLGVLKRAHSPKLGGWECCTAQQLPTLYRKHGASGA